MRLTWELASAEIYKDFTGEPVLDGVNPAFTEVVAALGAGEEGEVNGVPFACDASGTTTWSCLSSTGWRCRPRGTS